MYIPTFNVQHFHIEKKMYLKTPLAWKITAVFFADTDAILQEGSCHAELQSVVGTITSLQQQWYAVVQFHPSKATQTHGQSSTVRQAHVTDQRQKILLVVISWKTK